MNPRPAGLEPAAIAKLCYSTHKIEEVSPLIVNQVIPFLIPSTFFLLFTEVVGIVGFEPTTPDGQPGEIAYLLRKCYDLS